ncbi:protein ALWAYS EARLY 2-like isoform X1 [Asparagus officinalis]|nr:protein ALWAYS EARLY 2-like isoform X1 [Asparagus officinalis]
MASTRKSRGVNKRFAKINEEWTDKDATNANKNRPRKKKLSDMLGPQWSKEELERFYEAYRKHGKDWRKVSGTVRNRSSDMVEALYNMNKAYLSLPEGIATAAGLIAMMTDHYNILEGSDSEHESNDVARTSRRPQKRARGKYRLMSKGPDGPCPDLLQLQSASSSYACMSLLKRKRSGDLFPGSRPRAVGKRTPRIPVSSMYSKADADKMVSVGTHGSKCEVNTAADEGVHVAALALAEASQKGGSPQVSRTPGRRGEHLGRSPVYSGERKDADSEMDDSRSIGGFDEDYPEVSLGSREAENGDFTKDLSYLMDTGCASTYETHKKEKKLQGKQSKTARTKNDHFDDDKEACSGTEEGLNIRNAKDESEVELTDGKSARKSSRKRSRQLFSGDESTAFDALQTLADLSFHILLPSSTVDSESSIQVKDEKRNIDCDEKSIVPESMSATHVSDKSKVSERKVRARSTVVEVDAVTRKSAKHAKGIVPDAVMSTEINQQAGTSNNKFQKRKRKPLTGKVSKTEFESASQKSETQKIEAAVEEGRRSNKLKRFNQGTSMVKQGKSSKSQDRLSSGSTDLARGVSDLNEPNMQISTTNQVSLPTKVRSRRKLELQKALAGKESKPSEITGEDHSDSHSLRVNNRMLDSKERLLHGLSSRLLRRWCVFEWFYSAIDYPWFAKTEFVEYLNHVKLGHVPRLTRVEWGVIRSSLGKPRRLSRKFLQEEREKLEQYRESVRTHYTELRAGVKEGLPTDLARPLSVGQRVSACHPKTREIHDGSVLTVDRNRCRVQFDRPELGVEFVMDIDCMPLNPFENMPEALKSQNAGIYKFCDSLTDIKLEGQPKDWKIGLSTKSPPNESLEIADGSSYISSPNYPMNTLMKQAKGDTIDAIVQAKAAVNEVVVAAKQAMYNQPCTLAQIQAREADIKALAELARALDKKEALLIELRHMNEEVSGSQKGSSTITDLENFRKQYAVVLLQLRDANDQVASALLYMRQRNTYPGNSTPPWQKSIDGSAIPVAHQGSFNPLLLSQDSGSDVLEIVQSSRQKARSMVDVAVQATRGLKEGEDAFIRIGEALGLPSRNSNSRYIPSEPAHENSAYQDRPTSCKLEGAAGHTFSPKPNISNDGNEQQLPADMISNCVATLFMIQNCAERQYPPAEVAQVLDSAVTSLQPSCPQNLPVYREIETCMGIIKNQMLALIPTQSTCSAEASMV